MSAPKKMLIIKIPRVRRTPEDELETTVKSGLFLRNRLIFDGGFDGGFVNFWDGFYSYTIFYLLKSGLFMQKNNLTTYALAKNQGFNSPRLHQNTQIRTQKWVRILLYPLHHQTESGRISRSRLFLFI